MRKFLGIFLLGLTLVAPAQAAVIDTQRKDLPDDVAFKLNNSATAGPVTRLGSNLAGRKIQLLKAVYSFSELGGSSTVAQSAMILRDATGGHAILPINAIIKRVMVDSPIAFTGSQGAKVSLGVNTAIDLMVATGVGTLTGRTDGIPVGSAATSVKVLADRSAIVASVTGNVVTAGKMNVYIEYYLGN